MATEQPSEVFDGRTYRHVDEILLASGAVLPATRQVPLLDSFIMRSTDDIHGSVRSLRTAGGELLGRVHFAACSSSLEKFGKVIGGHLTHLAAGYVIAAGVEIQPGQQKTIDGRTFRAAKQTLRIVTRWKLKTVSLAAIELRPGATFRSDADRIEALQVEGALHERTRIARIEALQVEGVPAELVCRAINEGWPVERAAVVFLQAAHDAAWIRDRWREGQS